MADWHIDETSEHREIRLTGAWNLLNDAAARQHIAHRLKRLSEKAGATWDLRGIERLDSAGALLLWRAWGKRWPAELRCSDVHRQWFKRFEGLEAAPARERRGIAQLLAGLGARLVAFGRDAAGLGLHLGQLVVDFIYLVAHPRTIPWREGSAGVYRAGAASLPLIGAVALLVGVVMTYQLAMSLRRFGANTMIISIFPLAVLRELSPVITGLLVAARSGAALTASLGAMKVTEEFDALRAFGASPTQRLVLPKVIAMAISVPLIVLWSDCLMLAGGILVADVSLDVPYPMYLGRLPHAIAWVNLWIGVIKGVVFGFIVGTVAGYFGLKSKANTQSLGNETTTAVVTAIALIILVDAVSGAMMTNVGLF